METDKRQFERIPCELESTFVSLDADHRPIHETVVEDLSEGGARFRTNRFLSVHQRLMMRLSVPGQKTLEILAKPAWIREIPSTGQFDIGAKFLTLSEEDRVAIRGFLGSLRVLRAS